MRKIGTGIAVLTLGVLMTPAGLLWAQDAAPPPNPPPAAMHDHGRMSPEHQLRHMTRELNLNSDQQGQVGQILRDRDAQMMQMHQNGGSDPKAMHEQMRTLMTDSDAKIRGVLNPEQQQKFDAMRAQQRGHRGMGPGMGPQGDSAPPPPPPQQ